MCLNPWVCISGSAMSREQSGTSTLASPSLSFLICQVGVTTLTSHVGRFRVERPPEGKWGWETVSFRGFVISQL